MGYHFDLLLWNLLLQVTKKIINWKAETLYMYLQALIINKWRLQWNHPKMCKNQKTWNRRNAKRQVVCNTTRERICLWCTHAWKPLWNSSQLLSNSKDNASFLLIYLNIVLLCLNSNVLLPQAFLCSRSLLCPNYWFFQAHCTWDQ